MPFDMDAGEDREMFNRASEAVRAIRGRGRRQDGTAAPGNTLALKSGLRSSQLLQQPDVAAWHREQVDAITADLGGESELTAMKRASVREAARLEVLLDAMGTDLLERGVVTGKGRTRAMTSAYLSVLDRFVRLSAALGLERKAKQALTPAEYWQTRQEESGDA